MQRHYLEIPLSRFIFLPMDCAVASVLPYLQQKVYYYKYVSLCHVSWENTERVRVMMLKMNETWAMTVIGHVELFSCCNQPYL